SLLAFGGIIGHKGFALSMMVELLSGALSGAGCTGAARTAPGNAMFLLVVDPEAVGSLEGFQTEGTRLIDWVKASPPLPGGTGVMAPGEPEFREEERRRAAGIPLDEETWRQLRELAATLRSEEHTSELQSPYDLVCRLLLEKKKQENLKLLSATT